MDDTFQMDITTFQMYNITFQMDNTTFQVDNITFVKLSVTLIFRLKCIVLKNECWNVSLLQNRSILMVFLEAYDCTDESRSDETYVYSCKK